MRFVLAALLAVAATPALAETPPQPGRVAFRTLLKEMVETDTSITTGSCTALADKIAARLKAAGYADDQIVRFAVPDHAKEGGLVAILPGSSKTLKPLLLLGHLDVVAAKREDWTRDPYAFIEEDGNFYGRGVADMKVTDAYWVDTMIRLRRDGPAPERTVKMALTCGEETTWAFNGAEWLAKNRPDLIAAEFALNEGGGGDTDGKGKLVDQALMVSEKAVQNYRIEATNPGGHSSIPVPDNAIYHIARALARIADHDFPLELNDTSRAFFAKTGVTRSDDLGRAMIAIARDPADAAAEKVLNTDRTYHSMLRTTCVATLLDGGHANNALPQRAGANINCRILPGHSVEETQATLTGLIADPAVKLSLVPPIRPLAKAPPMSRQIMAPMEKLIARHFPNVPLVPTMATGASDGIFLEAIGIPTYGIPGPWFDPDGNGVHGLNERIAVDSAYAGRDFTYDLIRAYAG